MIYTLYSLIRKKIKFVDIILPSNRTDSAYKFLRMISSINRSKELNDYIRAVAVFTQKEKNYVYKFICHKYFKDVIFKTTINAIIKESLPKYSVRIVNHFLKVNKVKLTSYHIAEMLNEYDEKIIRRCNSHTKRTFSIIIIKTLQDIACIPVILYLGIS